MSAKMRHIDRQGNLSIFTVCVIAVALILLSFRFTGTPYLAAAISVGVPILIFACLKPKRLVYLLIAYCCVYPYLTSDLGMPRALSYVGDFINILALLFALRAGNLRRARWGLAPLSIALFCLVALISAIINGVSCLLVLWEIRNVFRFFVFLIACIGLLGADDIKTILRLLVAVFVVNLFICSFESLVLHYGQDNTNGLFGSGAGGNAATDILLLEMSCLAVFGYGKKTVKLPFLLLVIGGSCWIAVIAELKFYFIQLAFLVAVYVLVSKPSLKNLFLVAALLLGLYAAVQFFYAYMPGWSNFFDFQNILESSSEGGYGSSEGLNRLSAIDTLHGFFFHNPISELLGLGFGAGTYSQYFQSPLYSAYGEILHWTWFTDAQIYLETGIVGLTLYIVSFVLLAVHSLRGRKTVQGERLVFLETGAVMALFCVLLVFYNCVLTVDPGGYLVFLFLSFPLIIEREDGSSIQESEVSQ